MVASAKCADLECHGGSRSGRTQTVYFVLFDKWHIAHISSKYLTLEANISNFAACLKQIYNARNHGRFLSLGDTVSGTQRW